MKLLKYLSTIIALIIICITNAQEKQKVNFSPSEIKNSNIILSDHWSLDIEDNNLRLFNGSIKNNSNKTYKKLNLHLYLIDENKTDSQSFTGIDIGKLTFNALKSNSQITGINILTESKQDFQINGEFKPIVVVSDKKSKILAIQDVSLSIVYKDGKPLINSPEKKLDTSKSESTVKNLGVTDLNKIKLVEDNSVVLTGEWKVEIDFKNFLVKLKGGDIANHVDLDQEDVAFEIFLTDEKIQKITNDFNGVKIASSKLGKPLDKKTTFFNTEITSNIIQIPQPGTYYILVTIMTPDTKNDGEWVVRSKRTFPNSVSF